jgi:hypothetical protein
MAALAAGCGTVDKNLADGVDALAECDIRGAHEAFGAAYEADPEDPRAALGFALTDLALLPEDPAVTAALGDIGFSGALDVQLLVFGPDGILARSARGDSCDSIDAFIEANIPYAPVSDPEADPLALLADGLTIGDLLDRARALDGRLGTIAVALETAAAGLAEPIEVEGGCGLGTLAPQPPELYAAAAIIETVRSALQLSAAYDWDITVRSLFDDDPAQTELLADSLNQHFGRVVNGGAAAAAADRTRAAMRLVRAAVAASSEIQAAPEGALFDWSLFPATLAIEIDAVAASIAAAVDGAAAVAGWSPTLELDLGIVFAGDLDLGTASTPIFAAVTDEFGTFLEIDDVALAEPLEGILSPVPWTVDTEASFALIDQLDAFDPAPVTAPVEERYRGAYDCMVTSP